MSGLIARLLLAFLLLPTAAALYGVGVMICYEIFWGEITTFAIPGALILLYIATYWLLLWYKTIKWTTKRIGATAAVTGAAFGIGIVVGVVGFGIVHDETFGIFLGTIFTALAWLVGTVFVWRETDAERMARLRMTGKETIICLNCGYNLTGLKKTTCPECGAEPTMEELLAGQPSRAEAELAVDTRD
jgi:hypothetical protein